MNPEQRTNKIKLRRVILSAVFVLIFSALVIFTVLSLPSGGLAAMFAVQTGQTYPYSVEGQSASMLLPAEFGIEVIFADGVTRLDNKAKELYSRKLDYADPTASSAYGNSLIANRTDGRYFLHGKKDVIFEGKLQNPVTLTALSKKNAALASQSAIGEARLEVLDKRGKSVYSWSSGAERIASLSLSQSGRYAAAALLRMDEGESYCRILIFDVNKKEIAADIDLGQEIILRVCFTSSNSLLALSENLLICLKTNGERTQEQQLSGQLERFAFSPDAGGVAALITRGEDNALMLNVYDSNGLPSWSKSLHSVSALTLSDKSLVIAQDDMLELYDKAGNLIASANLGGVAVKSIVLSNKIAYILTNKAVERFTF